MPKIGYKAGLNVNEFSQGWADHVYKQRRAHNWTRRAFAKLAEIDPSHITHFESYGHIPNRKVVEAIGHVFGNIDESLVKAGMLPRVAAIQQQQKGLKERRWVELMGRLPEEATNALELLSRVTPGRQRDGLRMLCAYVTIAIKVKTGQRQVANV